MTQITAKQIKDAWRNERAAYGAVAVIERVRTRRPCRLGIAPNGEVATYATYWAEPHYKNGRKRWVVYGRHDEIKVACEVYSA